MRKASNRHNVTNGNFVYMANIYFYNTIQSVSRCPFWQLCHSVYVPIKRITDITVKLHTPNHKKCIHPHHPTIELPHQHLLFVNWNNDEVFFEQIHIPRPCFYSSMTAFNYTARNYDIVFTLVEFKQKRVRYGSMMNS